MEMLAGPEGMAGPATFTITWLVFLVLAEILLIVGKQGWHLQRFNR